MSRPTISPRSWPAQNAGPEPSMTIARTSGSRPISTSAAVASRMSSRLSALRCAGRLSVIRAAGPSRRTRTGPAAAVSEGVSSALMAPTIRRGSAQHEPEPRAAPVADAADGHQERAVEDVVGPVARLAGEVELRREDLAVRALDLHVDVPRAAGIEPRHDRPQRVAAAAVGELMAAEAIALV